MESPADEKVLSENDGAVEATPGDAVAREVPAAGGDTSAGAAPSDTIPSALLTAEIRPPPPTEKLPVGDDDQEIRLRRLTRRGFGKGGVAVLAGLAGWRWLVTRSTEDGLPWPLRRVLEWNERLGRATFSASRLSPEFTRSAARMPRVNGTIGLVESLDVAAWRLKVVGSAGEHAPQFLTLDDLKALPRVEMTTELRCIEGWSDVVYWAGAAGRPRLAHGNGDPRRPVERLRQSRGAT